MTVRYGDRLRFLLIRWKASVYRLVWKDLLVFIIFYVFLSCLYRFILNKYWREVFEDIVINVDNLSNAYIPIQSLLLGFYVTAMVTRWWSQFELIPWPEELLGYINYAFYQADTHATLIRRSIARYICLSFTLAGRLLAPAMLRRFPTEDTLVEAGLMTDEELILYNEALPDVRWFLPITWIQAIVVEHGRDENIPSPITSQIQREMNEFIVKFRKLFCYDWVNIPLVYTQVVAIATYAYFVGCCIGRQFITPTRPIKTHEVDYYVPVFTLLQQLFYLGWFRVGQNLMKPFGEDDEDFELTTLLDRHLQVAFALADSVLKPRPGLKNLVPYARSSSDCLVLANDGAHEIFQVPLQSPHKSPRKSPKRKFLRPWKKQIDDSENNVESLLK